MDAALKMPDDDVIGSAVDAALGAPKDYPGGQARAATEQDVPYEAPRSFLGNAGVAFSKGFAGTIRAVGGQRGADLAQTIDEMDAPHGAGAELGSLGAGLAQFAPAIALGPAALVPTAVAGATSSAATAVDEGSSTGGALMKGAGTFGLQVAQVKALSAPAKTMLGGLVKQMGIGAGYSVTHLAYDNAVDVADGKKTVLQASQDFADALPAEAARGAASQVAMHGFNKMIDAAKAYRQAQIDKIPTAERPAQTVRETGTPAVNIFDQNAGQSSLHDPQGPPAPTTTVKKQAEGVRSEAETYAREMMTSAAYGNFKAGSKDVDPERVLGAFKNTLEQTLVDRFGMSKTKARKMILKYKDQINALPASVDPGFDNKGRGVPNDVAREAESLLDEPKRDAQGRIIVTGTPIAEPPLPSTDNIDRTPEQQPPAPDQADPLMDLLRPPPPFTPDPRQPHPAESIQTGQKGLGIPMAAPHVSAGERGDEWTMARDARIFGPMNFKDAQDLAAGLQKEHPEAKYATTELFNPGAFDRPGSMPVPSYTVVQQGEPNVKPSTKNANAAAERPVAGEVARAANGPDRSGDANGAANGVAGSGVGESRQTATRKLLSRKAPPEEAPARPAPQIPPQAEVPADKLAGPEPAPKKTKTRAVLDRAKAPKPKRFTLADVSRHLDEKIDEMGVSPYKVALDVESGADEFGFHPDTVNQLGKSGKMRVRRMGVGTSEDESTNSMYSKGNEDRILLDALLGHKGRRDKFAEAVLNSPSSHDPQTVLNAWLYDKWKSTSAEDRKVKREFINPKELPVGTTVSILGDEFDVAIGKDGEKVLADGVIIPVDGLEKLPIDPGSQHMTDPNKTVEDITGFDDGGVPVYGERPKFGKDFKLAEQEPLAAPDDYGLPPELMGEGDPTIDDPAAFDETDSPSGVQTDLLGNPFVEPATGSQQGLAFPEESSLSKEAGKRTPDVEGQQSFTTPGRGRNQYPGARGGFVDVESVARVVKDAAKAVHAAVNGFTGEMVHAIRNTAAGKRVGAYLDDASSKAATLVGKFANQAHDAYKGLESDDHKWLETIAPGQLYSNRQRLVDNTRSSHLTAPNPRIQKWVDAHKLMMDVTGDAAISVGVLREDGTPFQKSSGPRAIREFTPDAWEALHHGSGPLFEAIADTIAAENNTSVQQAKDILREQFDPSAVRKVGALENYRKIEFLPDHVKLHGDLVPILEADPYLAIMNAGKRQAQRIYFVEKFGQETKGQPITALDRLRASHVQQGGSATAFDDVVRVWNGRPYGRLGGDPRNILKRAGKVIDTLISGEQTSMSVLPNIPQTAVQVPRYTGFINLAKGFKQALLHPHATAASLAEAGAVNRSVMEWTIRNGHAPEDMARIFHDLVTRGLGSHWINQFNSLASGAAAREMANQWRMKGLGDKQLRVAKELRLLPAEIAAARKGIVSKDTENKIIQNVVKATQYNTEDPHRRAMVQNVPILNFIFGYNSYFVGTSKSVVRAVDDVRTAMKSGNAKQMQGAGERALKLAVGMMGAGAVSMMLRRIAKGQPIKADDENAWDLAKAALWEAGVMGSAQRFVDAFHWSNGSSVEKFAMAAMPKVAYLADFLNAVFTTQKYKKFGIIDALADQQRRNTPIVNSALNAVDRARSPQYREYLGARSKVADWMTANDLNNDSSIDAPANPVYIKAARHVGMGDLDDAGDVLAGSLSGLSGKKLADAIQGIEESMQSRSPLGRLSKEDIPKYLKSLAPDDRKRLLSAQQRWLADYGKSIGKAMKQYHQERSGKDAA